MLTFLKELPNIYIILIAFVLSLFLYIFTRENGAFQLVTTIGGALTGIAMKESKTTQTLNAGTVENADISMKDTDNDNV